jgi:hypothetical protein
MWWLYPLHASPSCVRHLEMSLFLPFRNVTVDGGRAAGGAGNITGQAYNVDGGLVPS